MNRLGIFQYILVYFKTRIDQVFQFDGAFGEQRIVIYSTANSEWIRVNIYWSGSLIKKLFGSRVGGGDKQVLQ